MRKINEIIIHCSATPEGRDVDAETIRKWHLERGFNDIGYHYIIRLDGTVESGRPLEVVGAHTTGHNSNSIGICYVGGCDKGMYAKDTRTSEQSKTLEWLCKNLIKEYPSIKKITGHYKYTKKACPSFDVEQWLKDINLNI